MEPSDGGAIPHGTEEVHPQQPQEPFIQNLERFQYESLDQSRPCIRLLRLLGEWEKPEVPACEIFHVNDWPPNATQHSYEALSYSWGSPNKNRTASVNGKALVITENLYWALYHLRIGDQSRTLWIDAICIDQSNLSEKSHQVSFMGEIFSCSHRVIFWLGNPDADSDLAMRFLEDEEARTSQEVKSKLTCDKLDVQTWEVKQSLEKLLRRQWFYRVWIIQEVIKARSAVFACGKYCVQVDTFRGTFNLKQGWFHVHPLLETAPGASGRSFTAMSLYFALNYFRDHEATDERDKIFALLGVISPKLAIEPDYAKSDKEVAREVFALLGNPREEDLVDAPNSVSELIYGLRNCRWRHLEAYYNTKDPTEYERLAYLQYSGP